MADKSPSSPKIKVFAAASFFNDLGSDMIYPIWPLFVTSVLGANMAALGFLGGLGNTVVALSQAASGYLSDRIKRRKIFVWTGYVFSSISRLGYAGSSFWPQLIPFRVLDRAGKIRSAPRDAIIADESLGNSRGSNYGLVRAMDHLGAATGVLLCIVLISWLQLDYRTLFVLAAFPSLISAILVFFKIREVREKRLKLYKGWSIKSIDRNFALFLVVSVLFAISTFSYSFLLIFARQHGFATGMVPVLYLAYSAIASLFSFPSGRLADHLGRKPILGLSICCWAAICLLLILNQSQISIVIAFILYGIHLGALEPVQKTFVSELTPREYRASSLGFYQLVLGAAALPASVLAGWLWESYGVIAPFVFSLCLALVALLLLTLVKEPQHT